MRETDEQRYRNSVIVHSRAGRQAIRYSESVTRALSPGRPIRQDFSSTRGRSRNSPYGGSNVLIRSDQKAATTKQMTNNDCAVIDVQYMPGRTDRSHLHSCFWFMIWPVCTCLITNSPKTAANAKSPTFKLPSAWSIPASPCRVMSDALHRVTEQHRTSFCENPITVLVFREVDHGPITERSHASLELEAIVAKRRDRPYRSGRSTDWIKVKNPERRLLSG